MKKIVLSALTLASAVAICAGLLCGCSPAANTVQSPEPTATPEPMSIYEINDDQIGVYNANDKRYDPEWVEQKADSPLAGLTIYWLGSSVTDGMAAGRHSMADYLAALTGCISVKEAVSGTTILDNGDENGKSYTYRLTNSAAFDPTAKIDAFICQVSTNDAIERNLEYRGALTPDDVISRDEFDLSTTMGGVEYIISYVTETWHCPIYFYSGGYFGDEGVRFKDDPTGSNYALLVSQVQEAIEKWNQKDGYSVEMIDLYNDEAFNAQVNDEFYKWCMQDGVHPRRAGYLQWWTPYFETFLSERLTAN